VARARCTFRQQDATRAARAALAAGLDVRRIEIDREGKIVVVTAKPVVSVVGVEEGSNDWADAE
jgi:hypothetical protein